MIIKAVFFIAAIALLAPREPNVGYGTPGSNAPSTSIVSTIQCKALEIAGLPCSPIAEQAMPAPDTSEQMRVSFLERLQDVKAELRAARR